MEKSSVVITYTASPEQKAQLQALLGVLASLTFLKELPQEERKQTLAQADAVLSWNFGRELPKEEYSSLKPGALIQLVSAGADHMPFDDLPSQVTIASNPGAYALPMAEHVMAMTLALAKRLLIENQKLQRGEFDQFTPNRQLHGMTAGILGFGGIGRATARLMRGFGVRIIAINQSGSSSEPTDFLGTLDDLERVLRESDVVLISLPLTKATRGLIGSQQLSWMKPDAILVNVARGAIIDEEALYHHVQSHPDFRLGTDVWWAEPFRHGEFHMEYPFLELPNVLGSPHNSGMVPHISESAARKAAENVRRFLEKEPLSGIIRPEDYR
jgi:phosphoglycerate dehydrogenase-like enzyme